MALRALPLLYVNMGGEMLYILSQRLKAQRIDADKAQRGTCRFAGGSTRFGSLSARRTLPRVFPRERAPNRPQRPATNQALDRDLTYRSCGRCSAASLHKTGLLSPTQSAVDD
ncbi:hypothetical protein HPB52_005912 [Rhipicephalus sanguineus]|uniref:Uncharacterized protein n=1 Tax=Rhipicephalus sanguineus TaxID=34632 RepID=A0A9D4STT8_RHISA|nr:hypothetical protein HPB52_005912 [Rhipicephalus sanguineus]